MANARNRAIENMAAAIYRAAPGSITEDQAMHMAHKALDAYFEVFFEVMNKEMKHD